MNKYDFKLSTLSPVHIGCNDILSPYSDYIYREGRVHYIDKDKLVKFIMNKNDSEKIMEDYIQIIKLQASSNIQSRYSLDSFFERYGLELEDFISHSLEANDKITQIVSRTINSSGRPFIPGSSLKGSIRTSLIFHHIKEEKRSIKYENPYIGQDIFGKLINDHLKYLSISDTDTKDINSCKILKTVRYNIIKDSQAMPIIVEAIKDGTTFNFTIALKGNNTRFDYLNKGNIKKLLSIINNFSLSNISRELEVLQTRNSKKTNHVITFYHEMMKEIKSAMKENKEAILRIGSGKTIYDNTILLVLEEKHHKNSIAFPKTRTVTLDNNEYSQVLGWIKIELE